MINIKAKLHDAQMFGGLDKILASVDERTLRNVGFEGARIFKEELILRAPFKTGALRDNIIVKRAEEKSNGAQRQTYLVLVRKIKRKYANTKENRRRRRDGKDYEIDGDAFYWRFLEEGTSKMAAKPFIRPGFHAKKKESVRAMRDRLKQRLSEIK